MSFVQPYLNIKPISVVCPDLPAGLWLRAQPCLCYLGLLFLSGESVEWASWNSAQTSYPWPRSICSSQRGKWRHNISNHWETFPLLTVRKSQMGLSSVIRTFPTSKYSETSRQAREMYFFLSLGSQMPPGSSLPGCHPVAIISWMAVAGLGMGWLTPASSAPVGLLASCFAPLALLCLPLHWSPSCHPWTFTAFPLFTRVTPLS